MKTCSKCGEEKPFSLFAKQSRAKDGRHPWCRDCFRAYERERYRGNGKGSSSNKLAAKYAHQDVIRKLIWDYLLEHPCIDCGQADPRVLEFDHRDNVVKVAIISKMLDFTEEKVLSEISKCDVRCANCHRLRTVEQLSWWKGKWFREFLQDGA